MSSKFSKVKRQLERLTARLALIENRTHPAVPSPPIFTRERVWKFARLTTGDFEIIPELVDYGYTNNIVTHSNSPFFQPGMFTTAALGSFVLSDSGTIPSTVRRFIYRIHRTLPYPEALLFNLVLIWTGEDNPPEGVAKFHNVTIPVCRRLYAPPTERRPA